ncbi:hypothetical protein PIB30_030457 [Stylosanthes scabra]|uniref:Uncharacterized protein n=1 Tax=Stylosanthes scabra TaxID=79078 RepID=A0ABU6TDP6_9FABA|nr:hypothetical protein [Stylosanthes scabra]
MSTLGLIPAEDSYDKSSRFFEFIAVLRSSGDRSHRVHHRPDTIWLIYLLLVSIGVLGAVVSALRVRQSSLVFFVVPKFSGQSSVYLHHESSSFVFCSSRPSRVPCRSS